MIAHRENNMYTVSYITDVGLVRDHNEDAILVNEQLNIFIVADGMGGHEKGEVASNIVIQSFVEQATPVTLQKKDDDATVIPSLGMDAQLNLCVQKATQRIYHYAKEKEIEGTIGTTVVGLKFVEQIRAWVLFHLGDSRAYLYSQGSLRQLTVDHSKHEEMKQNNASPEEIERAGKNVITKAIGNFNAFDLDIQYVMPKSQDIFLLCSDGVTDLCTNDEILRLIIQYRKNLDLLCLQIKNLVYTRGAKDNFSVILVGIR